MAKRKYVPPADLAGAHAALDEKEEALAWLERGYAEHGGSLTEIKVRPYFAGLRSEARFAAIGRGMGLMS